jgi:hypothetical protein
MGRFDQDPELLRKIAESAAHAADEAWTHIEAEYVGNIPGLMKTLVDEGPYAYTIMPTVHADGSVKLPIVTTYKDIEETYKLVRGYSDLLKSEPVVEIRGAWYIFAETMNRARLKGQTEILENESVGLFPVSTGTGITGELVWKRLPRETLGRGPKPADANSEGRPLRCHMLALHNNYIKALREANVEEILDVLNDGVQGAIRDYAEDTGTLTSLDGKAAHRAYYKALFEKYDVQSVTMMDRVVQEWYLFAELRYVVRCRTGARDLVAFNVAEFFVPASDRRFIAQVGHGTDVVPAA